jgi:hypothetical protein
MSLKVPPIATAVGGTGYGDNVVRGRSVRDELLLRETRWSLVSRLVGGPELSREDAALLDDVLVAIACPDPRIWPLKVSWLLGAYGDWWSSFGAVTTMLAECRMGPWAVAASCDTAAEFARIARDAPDAFEEEVLAWARPRAEAGEVIWGFGVAGGRARPADERLAMIATAVEAHGAADRPHYAASMRAAQALEAHLAHRGNAALAVAAVALDLGMDRKRAEVVMYQMLGVQILGNAYDSAAQAPAILRRLPDEAVAYEGPPPRPSPRSRGSAP